MKTVPEVEIELSRLSRQTAKSFATRALDLATHLDDDALLSWANICLEISDAGWHAWETASLFIEISARYAELFGQEKLLSSGRYGLDLCSDSCEPCIRYYKGIAANLAQGKQSKIEVIETTGAVLTRRFEHASNLVADYFTTAFFIAEELFVSMGKFNPRVDQTRSQRSARFLSGIKRKS